MIQLINKVSDTDIIDTCLSAMSSNNKRRERLSNSSLLLKSNQHLYKSSVFKCTPSYFSNDNESLGELSEKDFKILYKQHFVDTDKGTIYDRILCNSKDKCPFCGGVGRPRSLDHYLAQSHYREYSLTSLNLVPSCLDCNMKEKNDTKANRAEDLPIHPYLDDDKFFTTNWIKAVFKEDNGKAIFSYYVNTPKTWNDIDKKRANNHFNNFNLAANYAIEASHRVSTAFTQIKRLLKEDLNEAVINKVLLDPEIEKSLHCNHWQFGMYNAIKQSFNQVAKYIENNS